MKILKRIVAVAVILLTVRIFFTPNLGQRLTGQMNDFSTLLAKQVANSVTAPSLHEETTTTADSDGIEDVAQNRQLKPLYYYHFEAGMPAQYRSTFQQAVRIYNQTGLVKLVPGQANGHGNELAFKTYHKQAKRHSLLQELGVGGPQIYPQLGLNGYDLNSGQAQLNATYPPRLSVALHEIGHALGLDHTENRESIMYPIDQGKTTFAPQDLANLRKIYHESK